VRYRREVQGERTQLGGLTEGKMLDSAHQIDCAPCERGTHRSHRAEFSSHFYGRGAGRWGSRKKEERAVRGCCNHPGKRALPGPLSLPFISGVTLGGLLNLSEL
jgi:hypothetical protein